MRSDAGDPRHGRRSKSADLVGFCKRIVADAETRQIVIETDPAVLAQEQILLGLLVGLCNTQLPEREATQIVQPAIAFLRPELRFRAA